MSLKKILSLKKTRVLAIILILIIIIFIVYTFFYFNSGNKKLTDDEKQVIMNNIKNNSDIEKRIKYINGIIKHNDEKVFVKFKDYGFFMPLNAKNEEVIVNGKAFLSVESVDELKHYAKDAGKSQAAIDSIQSPITTYAFLADGVLIKD